MFKHQLFRASVSYASKYCKLQVEPCRIEHRHPERTFEIRDSCVEFKIREKRLRANVSFPSKFMVSRSSKLLIKSLTKHNERLMTVFNDQVEAYLAAVERQANECDGMQDVCRESTKTLVDQLRNPKVDSK